MEGMWWFELDTQCFKCLVEYATKHFEVYYENYCLDFYSSTLSILVNGT